MEFIKENQIRYLKNCLENKSHHTIPKTVEYADVILPLAVPLLYTYQITPEIYSQIQVGCRVVVQLGNRKMYTAIVYSLHNNKPEKYFHIINCF